MTVSVVSNTSVVPHRDDWNLYSPVGINKIPEEGVCESVCVCVVSVSVCVCECVGPSPWQHVNGISDGPMERQRRTLHANGVDSAKLRREKRL